MKKKAPLKRKPKVTRSYNNTSRVEKSQRAQKTIIETLVKMLVERRGGEVQFDELAKASGISQRTIFRFFKDKQALHEATDQYLTSFVQSSIEQIKERDVVGFAKNTYATFDRNEALVMAYLFSPFGQHTRGIFRKKLNSLIMAQILKEKNLAMNKDLEAKLAIICSLVNAKIWYDIKTDFGLTGEQMGPAIEWAMKRLIGGLNGDGQA